MFLGPRKTNRSSTASGGASFSSNYHIPQLLLLTIPFVLIVVVSCVVFAHLSIETKLLHIEKEEEFHVRVGESKVKETLHPPLHHLFGLALEPNVLQAIQHFSQDPDQSREKIEKELTSLLFQNPDYLQARWLAANGMEEVRVERRGGDVRVTPLEELQNKSDRSYFQKTMALDPGGLYVSPFELNQENGVIQTPYVPTLRYAIRLGSEKDSDQGIIVINIDGQQLLDKAVAPFSGDNQRVHFLNQDGYWILSPQRKHEWDFMFGQTERFLNDYPDVWAQIVKQPFGQMEIDSGLWTWQWISLEHEEQSPVYAQEKWLLLSHIPAEILYTQRAEVWSLVSVILVAFLGLFSGLAFYLFRLARQHSEAKKALERNTHDAHRSDAEREVLKGVVEASPSGILLVNGFGRIMLANPQIEEMFGYPTGGLTGQPLELLLPIALRDRHRGFLSTFMNEPVQRQMGIGRALKGQHKDGHQFYLEVGLNPIDVLGERMVMANVIDVTERHAVEEEKARLNDELLRYREQLEKEVEARTGELNETNRFLNMVTDSLPGLVVYWNRNLVCEFANAPFCRWLGKNLDQIIGKSIRELLPKELYENGEERLKSAFEGNRLQFEEKMQTDSGPNYALINYIPDVSPEGVFGVVVLVTDITDVKAAQIQTEKLNVELKERTRQAEAASRAKSDFVANMSHEVRTPMNAILGLLQLLQDSILDNRQRSYLRKIQGASNALLRVLNDILDFSKLEAGQVDLENRVFQVEELLEGVSDLFALSASEKGLEVLFEVLPDVPLRLYGDQMRLMQILNNLVGNAVKFTESGSIHIKVECMSIENGLASLRFSVKDTGIGMTREQSRQVFDPFSQADSSTTRRFGGTGLGLSVCSRLVGLMGGDIGVQSREGEGSLFWFTARLSLTDSSHSLADTQLQQDKVLIVDDQPEVRKILQSYLISWGLVVDTASDLEQAMTKVKHAQEDASPYGLLLVDWNLPQEQGVTLCRKYKHYCQQTNHREGNVIFMVPGHEKKQLARLLGQKDVEPVLTTPVTPSRLYDLLGALQIGSVGDNDKPASDGKTNLYQMAEPIHGARILMVEDNVVNIEVAEAILKKMGLNVEVAMNGQEAVNMASSTRYDAILMDLQMPVMDGLEATRRIRSEEWGKNVPIIATTAAAFNQDRDAALRTGMNAYLAKPIDSVNMLEELLKWIPEKNTSTLRKRLEKKNETVPNSLVVPSQSSLLNISKALALVSGNKPLLEKLLLGFIRDFSDWEFRLSGALIAKDFSSAARLAHSLKGAAGAIGAETLNSLAAELEKNFSSQFDADLTSLMEGLRAVRKEILSFAKVEGAQEEQDEEGSALEVLSNLEQYLSRRRLVPDALIEQVARRARQGSEKQLWEQLLSHLDQYDHKAAIEAIARLRSMAQ